MRKLLVCTTPTCQPCKNLAPVLDELKKEHSETLEVEKINLLDNRGVIDLYNIKGVPFLIVFDEDGKVIGQKQGCTGKNDLYDFIMPFVKE